MEKTYRYCRECGSDLIDVKESTCPICGIPKHNLDEMEDGYPDKYDTETGKKL